jgi:hypothetical protein
MRERRGSAAAVAALMLGLGYPAISVYWGLGGTWLLATVGASLAQQGKGAKFSR